MVKLSKEEAVQWYAQNRGVYKKLSQKIHNIIFELIEGSNITIHVITDRAKEVDSFKNKIEDPKYDDPLNQITDLAGIRIIAYVEDDLKPICKIIEDAFDIDTVNSTDKSDELGTDKVGYKSIHYIAKLKSDRLNLPEYKKFKNLKFEIQVRTILQHAWAEIEHDRNYKFNGVLPTEIKRRFKILAGCLELMDREFNSISNEIDLISRNVALANKNNNLKNVAINSTTLKSYLNTKFKDVIKAKIINASFLDKDALIIKELNNFGIETLNDLKKIIPDNLNEKIKAASKDDGYHTTLLGLLRHIMLIDDADKYFTKSWTQGWKKIKRSSLGVLNQYTDLNPILAKFNLQILEEE